MRFLEGIKAYSANTATLGRGGGLGILHPPPLSSDTDISGEVGKALHEAKEARRPSLAVSCYTFDCCLLSILKTLMLSCLIMLDLLLKSLLEICVRGFVSA